MQNSNARRCLSEGNDGSADVAIRQGLLCVGVSGFAIALNYDLGHVQLDNGIVTIDLRISICPYATHRNLVTISGGQSTTFRYFLTWSRSVWALERLKL
jgi:hypothetical protein